MRDAVEVAAGAAHTCARRASGALVCWGFNDQGQLGDGTTEPRPTPAAVMGVLTASAVTAGAAYTCTAWPDRRVFCWGANALGQLGDGTTTQRTVPVNVLGLP